MVRKLEQYLADDAKAEADDRILVSRTEERREKQRAEAELFTLATKLTTVKPSHLDRLGLTDYLLDLIDEVRAIESAPARNRATKRLRAELRDIDPKVLNQKILALSEPRAAKPPDIVVTWCERLVGGSDGDLKEFLLRCPTADRAQLRNLVRNVQRAKPPDAKRANEKLLQAVRSALRASPPAPEGDATPTVEVTPLDESSPSTEVD